MSASKRPRSRPPMSGARVREARREKSWERAERSEESALSEPRCEQSSESCECVSAPRSTTCCASCGKVCASGGAHHGRRRYMREPLQCATTLSSLDAAVVTRRRHRVTSFAFPSGGAPAGASLHLRLPQSLCDEHGGPALCRVRRLHQRHRLRRLRPAIPASTAHLRRDVQLGFRRRLQRLQPRLGVPPGPGPSARQVDRTLTGPSSHD